MKGHFLDASKILLTLDFKKIPDPGETVLEQLESYLPLADFGLVVINHNKISKAEFEIQELV